MLYSQLGTVRLFPKFFYYSCWSKLFHIVLCVKVTGGKLLGSNFLAERSKLIIISVKMLYIYPPPNLAHISLKSCTITLTWHDCRSGSKVIISNTLVQRPYMLFSTIDYICLIPCQIIIGTYPWTKSLPQFSYSVFNFY